MMRVVYIPVVALALVVAAVADPRAAEAKRKKSPEPVAASSSLARPEKRVSPSSSSPAPAATPTPLPSPPRRTRVAPGPRRTDTGGAPTATSTGANDQNEGVTGGVDSAADGQAGTTTTKPTKTKVYTFGAMDVEGKLKTPQLLYFLNRVKLELDMSAPDHRSFMKELEKTAEDPNL